MFQKGNAILIIIILLALAAGGWYWYSQKNQDGEIACPADAKICPDGSAVGRTGPNCEFAACPNEAVRSTGSANTGNTETADWKAYRNEKYGFEFKYPSNFEITGSNLENGIYVTDKNKTYTLLVIAAKKGSQAGLLLSRSFELQLDDWTVPVEVKIGKKVLMKKESSFQKSQSYLWSNTGTDDIVVFTSTPLGPSFNSETSLTIESFEFVR